MLTGQAVANLQFILRTIEGLPEEGRRVLKRQLRNELEKFLTYIDGEPDDKT